MTSSPFRPLDDVTENSKWRIRKERPRVVIEMCWSFFAIFLRFWVIWLFSLTWKIPISGEILGVLGTPFTQKWFKVVKTPKRHFLGPDHVFWAIIRVCTIFRLTCRLVEEKKNELKTSPNRYIFFGNCPRRRNQAPQSAFRYLEGFLSYEGPNFAISYI